MNNVNLIGAIFKGTEHFYLCEHFNNFNENFVQNSLTNLKPEVIKSRITTDFPLILNIEPTNQCNARCYYCPREMMIKEQGISFMSLDTFRKIIDQIGENKLIILSLDTR